MTKTKTKWTRVIRQAPQRKNLVTAESTRANRAQPGSPSWLTAGGQQPAKFDGRDKLVLDHLPLVKAIAIRVHANLPVRVDLDDLFQAGILGLLDAAGKFNPDEQVMFSIYAKYRIRGAILDSLRQLDWASRNMRRRHKQVEAAARDLSTELRRNPTEGELARKLGVEIERFRTMMIDLHNAGLVSASTHRNEDDYLPTLDFSNPKPAPILYASMKNCVAPFGMR